MKIIQTKDFPISFFAMTMAFAGLTLAWRISGIAPIVTLAWSVVSLVLFVIVAAKYITKFIKCREMVIKEFENPIMMSFFGTISVSTMLISTIFIGSLATVGFILWLCGTIMHSVLVVYVLGRWLFHNAIKLEEITPACFIPIVGLVIVPATGSSYGLIELCWLFWGIGLALWIILFVLVFYRLMFASALPAPMMPTMFILIAPPSIIFNDYINLTGGNLDAFANVVYGIPLLITIILISQIKCFKVPFTMSYWAFTFPVVAFTMASLIRANLTGGILTTGFAYVLLVVVTILILSIFIFTIRKIVFVKN